MSISANTKEILLVALCAGSASDELVSAINTSVKANGSVPFSASVSMGANKITNLADPVNPQDAATKAYVLAAAASGGASTTLNNLSGFTQFQMPYFSSSSAIVGITNLSFVPAGQGSPTNTWDKFFIGGTQALTKSTPATAGGTSGTAQNAFNYFFKEANASANNGGSTFIRHEYVGNNSSGTGIAFAKARLDGSGNRIGINQFDGLAGLTGNGFDNDGTNPNYSVAGTGFLGFLANENFTDHFHHGTAFILQTTKNGDGVANPARQTTMYVTPAAFQYYDSGGSNFIRQSIPTLSASYTTILPAANPTANNSVLGAGTGGTQVWVQPGGDISVSSGLANIAVTKIQGTPVSATPPSDGQVLVYNAANSRWEPKSGATGSFTSQDNKTVTVVNGLITSIV